MRGVEMRPRQAKRGAAFGYGDLVDSLEPAAGNRSQMIAAFVLERKLMQQIRERLGVHQPMLDGHIQERAIGDGRAARAAGESFGNVLIEALANARVVRTNAFFRRPIAGDIVRKFSADGIDAERKKFIERGIFGLELERAAAEKIPIENFEMSEIKNQAMSFRNGPLEERRGRNHLENRVRACTRINDPVEERLKRLRHSSGCSHGFTFGGRERPN